jgi:hypothetical protein
VLRDPGAIAVAVLAAAAVGGLISGVLFSLAYLFTDVAPGAHWTGLSTVALLTALSVAAAFVGYLAGLLLMVGPLCALLHRLGRRERAAAVLAGAGLSVVAAVAARSQADGSALLFAAAVLAVAGGAAGWVLHRLAYREEA